MAGVLEAAADAILLAGFFTRPVAFLLSGEMAVAYFIGHAPQGFWPLLNGGTDSVFFCFLISIVKLTHLPYPNGVQKR